MSVSPSQSSFLSAVVCTHNRADLLRQTLESLCRQTLDRDAFEIVLVDDGSSDDTREVARAFESKLPLRYSHQRNAGLASARNHGVFLARGYILLFLDDDDVAHPGLLEAHCDTHRRFPQPHYGVLGFTELDPTIASDPLMHFVTQVGCFLFSYPNLRDGDVLDFSHFWGGRSSCKRAFLLDHGVFNPVFRFGCEDIELAFRLSRHGFRVVYNPRAVSTMVRRVSYDDFCWRLCRQGQSNFVFSRLHEDAAVQQCTEVAGARAVWDKVSPTYDAIVRSGRELDRIVRLRLAAGLPVDELEMELLHRGYWTAFRASKVKGIVERMAEMDGELAAATVPRPLLNPPAKSAGNGDPAPRIVQEPDVPSPPFEMKTLVCGAGAESAFEEVGRGAVGFMKSLGMIGERVRFLDVGCGCGRVARFLLDEKLAQYVGFDRNPQMIDWCRKHLATVDARFTFDFFSIRTPYERMDGIGGNVTATDFAFPYADGRFDSILLASVFSHMGLDEIDRYLRELRRVLSRDGKILASVLFSETDPYDNGVDFWYRPDDFMLLLGEREFRSRELAARTFGGQQNYILLT